MPIFDEENTFMGGYPVLSGKHINDPNAHPHYNKISAYSTLETDNNTKGYWAKLGTFTFVKQFKYIVSRILFMSDTGTSITSQRGILYMRLNQSAPMGSPPMVQLRLTNYANISPVDMKALTVQNTADITKIELYIKISNAFTRIFFNPIHVESTQSDTSIKWEHNSGLFQVLPPGAATDSLEDKSFVDSYHNTIQNLSSGWSKVNFGTKINDYRNEYYTDTFKFKPNQSGTYLIGASVRLTNPSANQRTLAVYINGTIKKRLASGSGSIMVGSIPVRVNAFEEVEIYINSPDAITVEGNSTDTYFTVSG